MVDTTIITAAGIVAAIIAAAAYSHYTGNEASVDTDGDGENELTFGDDDANETTDAETAEEEPSETADSVEAEGEQTEHRLENAKNDDDVDKTNTEPAENEGDVAETVDLDVPDELTDITGVGPTKASALEDTGLETPKDVYYASDENVTDVTGIGSGVLGQIRDDIGGVDYSTSGSDDADE